MSQDDGHGADQTRRPNSSESILSTGIGEATGPASPLPPELDLPRLIPEGAGAEVDEPVYDCIVYVLYCPEHQRVAVTNVNKTKCTWLPFVALPEGVTWQEASQDGVTILIGRNDAEMDTEEAERMTPVYTMRYLHLQRIQLPNGRMALRLSQFVQLERNTPFQCCLNSDRVNWLPLANIHIHEVDRIWGPELWILTRMLTAQVPNIINEFTIDNALYYLDQDQSWEHKLLAGTNVGRAQILDLYADYVEHCYPSFYMCFDSLRAYLIKNGHPIDEPKLRRLYQVFGVNRRFFVDFHEFLAGLVAMEPACPSNLESRLYFIFRYYSSDQQYLSLYDLSTLLVDANSSWSADRATAEAQSILTARSTTCLALDEFIDQYQVTGEEHLGSLCRSPKSIFTALSAAKTEEKLPRFTQSLTQVSRPSRSACWSCRPQVFEFGVHCVTFNTDGRCVEPIIMTQLQAQQQQQQPVTSTSNEIVRELTRYRHSLEYVFIIGSAPNVFTDLIRDFFDKRHSLKMSGLMASQADWPVFGKYLRVLCKDLSQVLANEEKLVKINSSAVVIGDLRGNLRDLLALEKMFFQGFPVIAENLVFLGNYSGENGFSVECLVFLFALKLLSPNKVYLLRGGHELGDDGNSTSLKRECSRKYGTTYGRHIHGLLVDIFRQLPIALLIDDTILCTHSGIPSLAGSRATAGSLDGLLALPKVMANVEEEAPMASDLLIRCPKEEKEEEEAEEEGVESVRTVLSRNVTARPTYNKISPSQLKSKMRKGKGRSSETMTDKTMKQPSSTMATDGSVSTDTSDVFFGVTNSAEVIGQSKDERENIKYLAPSINTKLRPTFLSSVKGKTSTRKVAKLKSSIAVPSSPSEASLGCSSETSSNTLPSSSTISPSSSTSSNASPSATCQRKSSTSSTSSSATFDQAECLAFLDANEYAYLIRSASLCSEGFTTAFNDRCLTVFSCSNDEKANNLGAVVFVDGSDRKLRAIRYDTSCGKN